MMNRPMQPIPVSAASHIAVTYGYDQVVIIARRVGNNPDSHGEHCTTYGRDEDHCLVAARLGNFLKHKVMGWPDEPRADYVWLDPATAPRDGSHFIGKLLIVGDDDSGIPDVVQAQEAWFSPVMGFLGKAMPWRAGDYGHDGRLGDSSYGAHCLIGWIPLPSGEGRP